ncbi:MAG: hypothetical protein AAGM38_09970 [Pseudomonadota bacterium]
MIPNIERVLVLEDDLLLGVVLVAVLSSLGVDYVEHVRTVPEAFRELEEGGYDAVVVDLWIEGKRATSFLRAVDESGLPMLVTSGFESGDVVRLVPKNAMFLQKPISTEQMRDALITLSSKGPDGAPDTRA